MRKTLILLSTLILLISSIPLVFSEVQFDTLALRTQDVDCTKCHPGSPHTLHEEVMKQNRVTCEACHGEALEIAIPQCEKCHGGTIHDAHIAKVRIVRTAMVISTHTTTARSLIQQCVHTATVISWMCITDVKPATRQRQTS